MTHEAPPMANSAGSQCTCPFLTSTSMAAPVPVKARDHNRQLSVNPRNSYMKRQPTSSAALVAVNEAKAWEWKCQPNRKEELVKLDLAAYRANIAAVPKCRSFRCNDDKAYAARESAFAPAILCCRSDADCLDALLRAFHSRPSGARPPKSPTRHLRLLAAVPVAV